MGHQENGNSRKTPFFLKDTMYLIRHAESTFNRFGDSSPDVPITDHGITQAKTIQLSVDIVICSPLLRARQTLEHSNITYKQLIVYDPCREHLNGNPVNYKHGEPVTVEENFPSRVESTKNYLLETGKEGTVAMITHHDFIHRMTGHYLGNCQIIQL